MVPAATRLPALLRDGDHAPLKALIYALASLSNLMRLNQDRFATVVGVSLPQYMVLNVLEDGEATVSGIAERLHVSSQFVTLESARLVAAGLAGKKPNPLDGRSVLLTLTATGRKRMLQALEVRRAANDAMFHSFTASELARLMEMVGRLLAGGREGLHAVEALSLRQERPAGRRRTS